MASRTPQQGWTLDNGPADRMTSTSSVPPRPSRNDERTGAASGFCICHDSSDENVSPAYDLLQARYKTTSQISFRFEERVDFAAGQEFPKHKAHLDRE